jgi:hypothetical protein
LRHSYASHALALGAPITYVSAQLGHSSPAMTLAVYSRWLPRADRLWAKRLEETRMGVHPGAPPVSLEIPHQGSNGAETVEPYVLTSRE